MKPTSIHLAVLCGILTSALQAQTSPPSTTFFTHDRLFGAGVYASYWFVPQKFGILARQTFEFAARDRFEGRSTALGFNIVF